MSKNTVPTKGHLGGFIAEGNSSTFSDVVWNYLIKTYDIKSMLDVGCGAGWAIKHFLEKGIDSYGVEGFPDIEEYCVCSMDRITIVDYEEQEYVPDREFDLIWSCEFVEHVKESCMENFLKTFDKGKYIAMTHATPGQAGHHHVNCKAEKYWVEHIEKRGFKFNEKESKNLRAIANSKPYGAHIKKTCLFFERS